MTPLEAAGRDLARAADILRWYRGMGSPNPEAATILYARFVACQRVYQQELRQECGRLGLGDG